MPLYEFKCECGMSVEIIVKSPSFEDIKVKCPVCEKDMKKKEVNDFNFKMCF